MSAETGKEGIILVITPALVAILLNYERRKGSPLTEEEVIEIRDNADCIAMLPEDAEKIEAARGYTDIDPEDVWDEWQAFRAEFPTLDNQ